MAGRARLTEVFESRCVRGPPATVSQKYHDTGTAVHAVAMLRARGVAEHATPGTSYTETKSRSTDEAGYNPRFIFLLSW